MYFIKIYSKNITNEYPDFGEERDGEAIKRRLKIFQTKALEGKIIPSLVIGLFI